jgi:hypothetical protein
VVVIGSTQSGKTGFMREILALRQHVIILVTKRDDYLWSGYKLVRTQREINPLEHTKFRLFPSVDAAQRQFADALLQVWLEKGWCICLDELYRLEDLKLTKPINTLLTQGASDRITVAIGVQRPAHVTRFAMSEPMYAVSFQLGDGRDNDTVKEWRGKDFARVIRDLPAYHWAAHNRVTGRITTGTRGEAASKIFDIQAKAPIAALRVGLDRSRST